MRRAAFAWGLLALGSLVNAAAAQEILPAVHRGHGGEAEPQRIVVKLPPPQVEVRDKCDDGCDRCERPRLCLFGHRRHEHHHKEHGRAAVGEVLYAPASIPTMMVPAAAPAPVTFSQQITHDFSALRNAQEMELRAAGVAAALAARDAMRGAEDEAMDRILETSQTRLRAAGGALRASSPARGIGKADVDNINAALKKLDDRLASLEELVERHHEMINFLRTQPPAVPPAKIDLPK
jgi:hypothetical protein